MKSFKVRLRIQPTTIRYIGFIQFMDCDSTHIHAEKYEAMNTADCVSSLRRIFGSHIISGFVVSEEGIVTHIGEHGRIVKRKD